MASEPVPAYLSLPGGWMPPATRSALRAMRPWSIPASLVPCVLAAALVFPRIGGLPQLLLPIVGALCLHGFGNLVNTWWDFHKGLDKKADADDRTLVDATVSPQTVAALAAALLVAGTAAGLVVVIPVGWPLFGIGAAGAALALFYTADPLSLKYLGLGDVCIFLAFGPLLMCGMAMAATQSAAPDPLVALASLPTGLLTVAIVHANNTRDIDADRAAGARTLAMALGFQGSYVLYLAHLAAAYVLSPVVLLLAIAQQYDVGVVDVAAAGRAAIAALDTQQLLELRLSPGAAGTPSAPLDAAVHAARAVAMLFIVTLPWCLSLARRFARRDLAELPQATAQFDLFFGGTLIVGLLPLGVLGRFCLGLLFYLGGFNNVLMWAQVRALVRQRLAAVCQTPQWAADALAAAASAVQLVVSVLFVFGIYPRLCAAVLGALLLPYSVIIHAFWSAESLPAFVLPPRGNSPAVSAKTVAAISSKRGRSPSVAQGSRSPAAAGPLPRPRQGLPAAAEAARWVETHAVPTFLTDFDNEFVHFFKNILALGGLLYFIAAT